MKAIATRFSAAAPTYDQSATVQAQVSRQLVEHIPPTLRPDRILEIGCGTGLLTAGLRRRFPHSRLDALDLAPAMIVEARKNIPDPSINWLAGDIHALPPGTGYQLLASSSSLHWLRPLEAGLAAVRRQMADGGRLACAIMLAGTLQELHQLRRQLLPHKPPTARLPDSGELRRALAANSLQIESLHVEIIETRHASAAELLRKLHDQGVTAGPFSHNHAPLVRGELHRLTAAYDNMFAGAGGVTATYQVAYLLAAKT